LSYAGYYFCRKPFYIAKATLQEVYGWDASTLALIGTIYLIAYTIGQFIAGWAGNRFGARVLLLTGMAVSIGCNLVFGFTNSWQTFAAFMLVNGLAQATGWSNNVGVMAQWFRKSERGTVMGFWGTNYQVGGVLANALAAFLLDLWGVQWSFFGGSIVLFAIWSFFVFNQANKPEDLGLPAIVDAEELGADGSDAPWSTDVIINILLVGMFYFFVKFIRYALWSWTPYLLDTHFGMDADDAGYLSTVFDLTGILGVILCGLMSDKWFDGKRAGISFIWIIGMAASCALMYLVGTSSITLFGICIGLIGFTLYGPDALMAGAGAAEVGSAKKAVLAVGIVNGMGSMGSIVQEFVMGSLLEDGSVAFVFAVLFGSSLLAAACLSVLIIRGRRGLPTV